STLTSTAFWFWGCSNLTTISGIENLNTSTVTDMKYMFVNCSSLIRLDLSTLNTKNVTNISQLFPGCSSLTSLDLSGFNTSNVTDMSYMFHGCSSLVTVYVGDGWNTSAVTEGGWMFSSCSNLVGGKGTKYDGEHADYTYARIDQGPDSDAPGYFTRSGDAPWVEPEPTEAYAVLSDNNTVLTFYYDNQKAARNGMSVGPFKDSLEKEWDNNSKDITSVVFDVSFANDSTLTSTTLWFRGFENLKVIAGIENLNTSNVTDMVDMFHDCSSLASLDLSSFNTANVTNMNSMFFGCSSLASLNLSGFDTSNVTDMVGMFLGCASLTSLDLSSFNTSNVTNMNSMFSGCSSLTSLDLRGFNTGNVTNMGWMFGNCSSLASLDLSSFNTSNVTAIWDMFFGCSSLVSLDLSSFNTEKVTNIYGMFNGCSGLTTIYAGEGWITANVTEGTEMFTNCSNLVGGKGTAYSADHADYTYARIDQGPDSDAPGY
ncbi:MAG: DUF285 domain-containing protein, partial [Prevotella sp.]|nr:DUF285 domain-containing protein [Prevotella sp.]